MPDVLNFSSVSFVRNDNQILKNINFQLEEADSLVILGRNGAGKTTLINLLFGYLWPTTGTISVFGNEYGTTPMAPLQKQMGIVQSNHQETLLQRLTAFEMVLTGLIGTLGLYADPTVSQIEKAMELLNSMSMGQKKDQNYASLSSGEKMKILLLRALGEGKRLLVLDEPAAALDLTARHELFESVKVLKTKNPKLTRILITHRLEEIPTDFGKILLLKNGEVFVSGNKEEVLTDANLSRLYDLNLKVHCNDGQYSATIQS
ncbi:ATP-binding cassette domain-containing protein [Leptospira sp. 96542]|nr:ATP-binding cassette domain-containing protein [Leptospira sp. 96542]